MQAPIDPALQHAMRQLELRSKLAEPIEVHIDRPRPEVITSRHGHPGPATSCQQRSEHHDRGAHLPDQLEWCLRSEFIGHGDGDIMALERARRTDMFEHIRHELDVQNSRHVPQTVYARCQ